MAIQKLSSSCTTTINEYLPEILLEILCKLPAKELHRNKIICKFWLSLISHPSFPLEYLLRRNSRPTLTLYLYSKSCGSKVETLTNEAESISWLKDEPRFSLNFLRDIPGEKFVYDQVLASSNGLLLCGKYYRQIDIVLHYVCNPVTKQRFIVPPQPFTQYKHGGLWGIVCYPSCETQFKVVRITQRVTLGGYELPLQIGIFESATEKWLQITVGTAEDIGSMVGVNAVEYKGIFYWEGDGPDNFIRIFDPNLHFYRKISLPGTKIHPTTTNSVLGQSQNHLYYALIDFTTPNIPRTITIFQKIHKKNIHVAYHLS